MLKDDFLINNYPETPLVLKDEVREKNNISNKLINDEILDVKEMISKIIISTKSNKNKLKKLYKKDKKINTGLIKFNRNKNKEFLKIVTGEINTIQNNHRKLENKFKKNKVLYEKNNKIILNLENENKNLKTNDRTLNIFEKKILYYQNDNKRLSSKLDLIEKQNKIINENLIISENTKDVLIKLITDLNKHFSENNVVKTEFDKKKIGHITDHKKNDFDKEINNTVSNDNLNEIINDIFN